MIYIIVPIATILGFWIIPSKNVWWWCGGLAIQISLVIWSVLIYSGVCTDPFKHKNKYGLYYYELEWNPPKCKWREE